MYGAVKQNNQLFPEKSGKARVGGEAKLYRSRTMIKVGQVVRLFSSEMAAQSIETPFAISALRIYWRGSCLVGRDHLGLETNPGVGPLAYC